VIEISCGEGLLTEMQRNRRVVETVSLAYWHLLASPRESDILKVKPWLPLPAPN